MGNGRRNSLHADTLLDCDRWSLSQTHPQLRTEDQHRSSASPLEENDNRAGESALNRTVAAEDTSHGAAGRSHCYEELRQARPATGRWLQDFLNALELREMPQQL